MSIRNVAERRLNNDRHHLSHADTSALFGTGEFFQRGNYAPVADELTEFDLPVEGAIPAELDGWYLRNGPNPRQADRALVHRRRHDPRRPHRGGQAKWYRNRWVRTDSFVEDFPLYNADGTRNLRASVANTHVVNHAGKTLALVESSLPYEISNDLQTLGAYDFGGKLVDSMTAHPKICPTTGELHFFGYGNIFTPHVTYHRADANGELTVNRPLDVPALTMMHDFALTAEHVVFMDLPIVFNLDVAIKGNGDMPYRWDDDYGARLGVLRRDDPFGEVRWFDIDPCYVFHVANAYDRDLRRKFHCAASGPLSGTVAGHRRVRRPTGCCGAGPSTWRPALSRERQLDDRAVEFPRIDDRLASLPARYAVSVGDGRLGALRPEYRRRGRARLRDRGTPGGPGEAVFVPSASGPADESNGWYIGLRLRPGARRQRLGRFSMRRTSPHRRSPQSSCRTVCRTGSTETG